MSNTSRGPSLIVWTAIAAFGTIAAFDATGFDPISPAFSQVPSPVTLTHMFDPDLADVYTKNQSFKDAIKTAHRECYPPRATFHTSAPRGTDPAYAEALASARADALNQILPSLGLDPGQFKVTSGAGNNDDVQASFDKFNPDDDKDAPKLKVTSTPKKGTKVKAGDKIKVTITASERYEDGHKSWPTGVQMIQLTADDGLVDSKQYGRPPQPCTRQVFEATYTVPRDPPPIVHLRAVAEDGVGNSDNEVGEFPTGDWQGRFHWSVHQALAGGTQDWTGQADLALNEDGKGGLMGSLAGSQNQKLGLTKCHAVTNGTVKTKLTGTVVAQKITINATDQQAAWPATTPCAEGLSAGTGAPFFKWPQFDEALHGLTPAGDGGYRYDHEFGIQSGTARFTLTLRRAEH